MFASANGDTDSASSEGTCTYIGLGFNCCGLTCFLILPDVPSGCEIQQLLGDIDQANTEVGDLSGYWRDLLNATLETAKKFEADHR